MGTFWSRGHQEGRMSTRDLAYIKWRVENGTISLGTCNQKAFFLSFELSKYVYIYMQYSLFYCFNKPLHYINWKWKNLLLSYLFFFILEWLLRQLSIGIPSVSRESNQALWWSHRFSLLVSLFLSLKSFPENNGKQDSIWCQYLLEGLTEERLPPIHYWMPLETRKLYFLHWFLRKNRKANYLEGYFPLWFCIWLRP